MSARAALHAWFLAVSGLTACTHAVGVGDVAMRPAEDTPVQFVTEDGVPAVQECRSPMIDPRDQTRLRLARSAPFGGAYRGDYEAPVGRYGIREGELLRIDCETGQAIGIVRN